MRRCCEKAVRRQDFGGPRNERPKLSVYYSRHLRQSVRETRIRAYKLLSCPWYFANVIEVPRGREIAGIVLGAIQLLWLRTKTFAVHVQRAIPTPLILCLRWGTIDLATTTRAIAFLVNITAISNKLDIEDE